MKNLPTTYSVLDVAVITNKSLLTIRRHIKKKLLKAKKIGKSYVITQENLDEYLK